jgi:hypothetical protein
MRGKPAEMTLVGRCFATLDEKGVLHYQGIVRARIDEQHYLVQYFEAMGGTPHDLAILPLSLMTCTDPGSARRGRGFMFFEDDEQLRNWVEHFYHDPPDDELEGDPYRVHWHGEPDDGEKA